MIRSMEHVVVLHGIWLGRWAMWPLARRLRRCGYRVSLFGYPSLWRTPEQNAATLRRFIQSLGADTVHLVGHSLGGRVILKLLERPAGLSPGRVVLLGSPVQGSLLARRLSRWRLTRVVLGRAIGPGGLCEAATCPAGREIGVLSGTLAIGIGLLLGGLPSPHDGTVAVSETRLDGASDSCGLRVTHLGMLLSRAVARQTCHFLAHGRFSST